MRGQHLGRQQRLGRLGGGGDKAASTRGDKEVVMARGGEEVTAALHRLWGSDEASSAGGSRSVRWRGNTALRVFAGHPLVAQAPRSRFISSSLTLASQSHDSVGSSAGWGGRRTVDSVHARAARGRTTWGAAVDGEDEVAPTWRHRAATPGGTRRATWTAHIAPKGDGVATGEREPAHRPAGRGATAHGPMIAGNDHRRDGMCGRRQKEGKGRGDGGGPHRGAPVTEGRRKAAGGARAEGGGAAPAMGGAWEETDEGGRDLRKGKEGLRRGGPERCSQNNGRQRQY
uniref:Uncharacterized protein n=1 Tax=Oryza sativa subsp. japonica TaxID=39947 RepID=Q6K3A2_ORYSJ|nr:hypothetical protein [Oryza sativa Japonica Group]